MLRTLLCDEVNQFLVIEDPSAISEIVLNKERHLWIDLEAPSLEDFRMIEEEFELHPLAIEDAMSRHQRPKVDQYENFYLVIFYAVSCEDPGTGDPTSARRGLRGTRFHKPGDEAQDESVGAVGTSQNSQSDTTAPPETTIDTGVNSSPSASAGERIVLRELTMFMGANFLVTVHTDPMPELDEVARRWRQNVEVISGEDEGVNNVPGTRPLSEGERGQMNKKQIHEPQHTPLLLPGIPDAPSANGKAGAANGAKGSTNGSDQKAAAPKEHVNDIGILLYSLLDTIVDDYFPVIDGIVDRVEDLEEQIFEKYNQQAIESIFTLKKDLLALRKVLAPERDVLNILTRRDIPIFEAHTLVYFQDIYDHVTRITDSIDTYRDLLSSALDSFLSMQSNRLNITVQTLTSFSIMLMSVATITGWYGMNFQFMPELHSSLGYPGVILTVALVVSAEAIFFKRKKWL